jgi:hypothetical protein
VSQVVADLVAEMLGALAPLRLLGRPGVSPETLAYLGLSDVASSLRPSPALLPAGGDGEIAEDVELDDGEGDEEGTGDADPAAELAALAAELIGFVEIARSVATSDEARRGVSLLVQRLATARLRYLFPAAWNVLVVAGILVPDRSCYQSYSSLPAETAWMVLDFDAIPRLLENPASYIRSRVELLTVSLAATKLGEALEFAGVRCFVNDDGRLVIGLSDSATIEIGSSAARWLSVAAQGHFAAEGAWA